MVIFFDFILPHERVCTFCWCADRCCSGFLVCFLIGLLGCWLLDCSGIGVLGVGLLESVIVGLFGCEVIHLTGCVFLLSNVSVCFPSTIKDLFP